MGRNKQFSVAVIVFWVPLMVAGSLGITIWLDWPSWLILLMAAPGIFVAALSQWLSPDERRVFLGIVSGTGAVVSVEMLVLASGEMDPWTNTPIFDVYVCTASALLGVLFSLWLTWKRGRRRR